MAAAGASGLYVNPNTGAAQAGLAPFRNALINGDMRINQRGTSANLASMTAVATASPGSWVADRWNVYRNSYVSNSTMAQGTNLTTSDLPFAEAGIRTFARLMRTNATSQIDALNLAYNMESQDCYQFIGKTITVSFYYRTGANFSGNTVALSIVTGTGNDQAIRSGYTGAVYNTSYIPISASWKRTYITTIIPTNITQLGVLIQHYPTGTAGANDYMDITGVQLELGSVATPFEVRPYPVELGLCQRYYEKSYNINTAPGTNTASGLYHISTTSEVNGYVIIMIKFAVAKRNNTYNVLGYRADGVTNQWYYERSGASSFATPGFDQKSESNFRLLVLGTLGFTPSVIIGHWVADAEI